MSEPPMDEADGPLHGARRTELREKEGGRRTESCLWHPPHGSGTLAPMKRRTTCLAFFWALCPLMVGQAGALDSTNAFIRSSVSGKEVTYRGPTGQIVGEAQRSGKGTVFRDPTGRIVQNVSESEHGQTFRDPAGRITGQAQRQGDSTVYRDPSGRLLGTASKSGDQTVFRDSTGRIISTRSFQGNQTVVRDATGRIVETSTSRPDPLSKTNARK